MFVRTRNTSRLVAAHRSQKVRVWTAVVIFTLLAVISVVLLLGSNHGGTSKFDYCLTRPSGVSAEPQRTDSPRAPASARLPQPVSLKERQNLTADAPPLLNAEASTKSEPFAVKPTAATPPDYQLQTETVRGRQVSFVKNQLIIKMTRAATDEDIAAFLAKHNLKLLNNDRLKTLRYISVTIPEGMDIKVVRKAIAEDPQARLLLKAVEPNYVANAMTIEDPLYSEQWYMGSVGFDEAWALIENTNHVLVAVVDTGVDTSQPDLVGRCVVGFNTIAENQDTTDEHGHGTFTAGLIAGAWNNVGIRGVCPANVEIVPIKSLDAAGQGTYEDAAEGIVASADSGARVINLGFGGYAYSDLLKDAVDYAIEKGCVVVAAGGNDGTDAVIYPAGYPDVIGVGALGKNGQIAQFSNRGPHIDLVAPGEDVLSTSLNGAKRSSGSSCAAAMVSGLTALLLGEKPDLSTYACAQTVTSTASDLGDMGRDNIYGNGLIEAERALTAETKAFHDLAVADISFDSLSFDANKPAYVLVTIRNVGTFDREVCDIMFIRIVGDHREEIGRRTALGVTGKITEALQWSPGYAETNVVFEAKVTCRDDTNASNDILSTKPYRLQLLGSLYVLYANEPPVHGWIAYQAFKKLKAQGLMSAVMESEIQSHIGATGNDDFRLLADWTVSSTSWNDWYNEESAGDGDEILEGAWEEDNIWNLSRYHFWYPESDYDDGVAFEDSALELAQLQFANAVASYGDREGSYYLLGRCAHLLMDMSVPAHVLGDLHIPPVHDSYETLTAETFRNITAGSSHTDIPGLSSLPALPDRLLSASAAVPDTYDDDLTKLFWCLAECGDDFPSDEGANDSPPDGYSMPSGLNYGDRAVQQEQLEARAIGYVAALYKLFWERTAQYRPSLLVTPNNRDVSPGAGTTTFGVVNTSGGTMAYTASEACSWLTITSGGSGGNSGTITVSYEANSSSTARSGTITVTASGAEDSPQIVTVEQAGNEASPTITSVSPSTFPGLPLPQTRLITITGTGFNASTRLTFNDGTTTYSDRVPASVTATRMTYNIVVGPDAATWTVKAVNGSAESAPFTFYVTSSGPAVLNSVSVSGPSAIYEETTSDPFVATAHYSDGSHSAVTPAWSVSSGPASISSSGVLTAGSVDADTAVTVFARYSSGGITKTGSVSVTVVDESEGGSETQELIVNGGFENGTTSWNMSGPIVGGNAAYPHSGSHYAVLGEVDSCVDVMYQEITIPDNATSVTLSYWLNIYSDETGSEGDFFVASIMDENGDLLALLDMKSNMDRDSGTGSSYYNEATFDLSGYAGETIRVRFAVVMNSGGFSSFKLDDVSVQADVPTQVYPFTTTTSNGKITITGYTGSGGTANIPPTINGLPVTSIGDWAFYGWDSLDSVTIPNSVTSIGNQAFNGSGIDSVTIPSSVTSIGDWAFAHCNNLAEVTIPSSVSRIGEGAFFECENLVDVIIRNGVTTIGNQAFRWCANLSDVTIPGSVTNIGTQSFDGCSSLTSVTIPSGVISIGDGAFSSCGDLYSVTIPSSVTSIGEGAFFGCPSLDYVNIPNSVNNIKDWMFCGCIHLGSVTIPNSVTNIGNQSFNSCAGLTRLTIPSSVANIGDWSFAHCSNLTSVAFPSSVARIGEGAFFDCPSLGSVTIPNSVTNIGAWAFFGANLIRVTIPISISRILDGTFSGCTNLANLTIPGSVTRIGPWAFQYCTGLTNITISESVNFIGNQAFDYCTSLAETYFRGDAPSLGTGVFLNANAAIVYYLPGTEGWAEMFGDRPTVLWRPRVQYDAGFGVRTNQFGFSINWASGMVVVVDGCMDLINPDWSPLETNTLAGDSSYFSDPQWTNYPARLYRLRWQ